MTPADFLESVTEAKPRKSSYRISYSAAEMEERLRKCTPKQGEIKTGDTQFFRKLGRDGIISYNEYLFLLCIITKPKQVQTFINCKVLYKIKEKNYFISK